VETVNREESWAYFNGAAQGEPRVCGTGGVLNTKDGHCLKFRAGLDPRTNNFVEFTVLKLLLLLVVVIRLQIYGDSMNVIKWLRKEKICTKKLFYLHYWRRFGGYVMLLIISLLITSTRKSTLWQMTYQKLEYNGWWTMVYTGEEGGIDL
jgi:ribonuclease HI